MEDFLGLLFLALFFILPKLFRKNHKKNPLPSIPPRMPPEVPLPIPLPIEKTPVVDDISFEPLEKSKRAPIRKQPVFVKKYKKKKVHASLKEIFILSEILKRPPL